MQRIETLFMALAMAAAFAMASCGDSGGGGGGDTDPNSVCADCAPGPDLEDCQNDLLLCDTLQDPGLLERCINDARC